MTPELKQNPITPETCFVARTHEGKGRRTAVKPGDTAARYLHYGRVRFFIEGKERIASAGDVLHFPSQCWHGATMMDEEVVLIDIFTPVREDFL